MGEATIQLMIKSTINSFESNNQTSDTDAPSTLRMPISFVRCYAMYAARPNNPRQEIKMASAAKNAANLPMSISNLNFAV